MGVLKMKKNKNMKRKNRPAFAGKNVRKESQHPGY